MSRHGPASSFRQTGRIDSIAIVTLLPTRRFGSSALFDLPDAAKASGFCAIPF
jgi:hypothetical protein